MAVTYTCPHCGHTISAEGSTDISRDVCVACGEMMIASESESAPQRARPAPVLFGLSMSGLALVCLCVGTVLAVLIPTLNQAIESARVNSCICHGKNIGLSLHNYHDIHGHLPLASTAPVTATPGDPVQAGYSWLVQLLPFIEEQPRYDEISVCSDDFKKPPFDPTILDEQPVQPNVWSPLPILVCPSTSESQVDEHASFVYKMLPLPGISSYIATSTSHLTTTAGPIELPNVFDQSGLSGNGVLVFPADAQQSPSPRLTLKSITDGTSKTLVFCESREATYAAWMDGQVTWGIAAWPRNETVPTIDDGDGFLGWPRSDTSSKTSLAAALEKGPLNFYLEGKRFGCNSDRKFGPSSNHAKGKVLHCFADGHVLMIPSDQVDRNIYLRIYARGGGEPIPPD